MVSIRTVSTLAPEYASDDRSLSIARSTLHCDTCTETKSDGSRCTHTWFQHGDDLIFQSVLLYHRAVRGVIVGVDDEEPRTIPTANLPADTTKPLRCYGFLFKSSLKQNHSVACFRLGLTRLEFDRVYRHVVFSGILIDELGPNDTEDLTEQAYQSYINGDDSTDPGAPDIILIAPGIFREEQSPHIGCRVVAFRSLKRMC